MGRRRRLSELQPVISTAPDCCFESTTASLQRSWERFAASTTRLWFIATRSNTWTASTISTKASYGNASNSAS